jgi:hypothetical protein
MNHTTQAFLITNAHIKHLHHRPLLCLQGTSCSSARFAWSPNASRAAGGYYKRSSSSNAWVTLESASHSQRCGMPQRLLIVCQPYGLQATVFRITFK